MRGIERAAAAVALSAGGRDDKLLDALIDKLPAAGAGWPRADRLVWLELMAKAFDVVYGREDAIDIPQFLGAPVVAASIRMERINPPSVNMGDDGETRFYIAADGRALRDPGQRPIKVGDVPAAEVIWDERPAGNRDLDSIVWADGQWPAAALPSLNFAG